MDRFEEIYVSNVSRVYGFIYKMCRDAFLAEELTQECFYQAFRSFHRYNGSCELFTWLAAIAKNVYFKYLRKNKQDMQNYEYLAEHMTDVSTSPDDAAIKSETIRSLRRAINKLGPKYRDVLICRIYAELPFSQIARSMGITENSAKVIFYRAKATIAEELKNENIL